MKKSALLFVTISFLFSSCNFDQEHNKLHQQEFEQGMSQFHELFDYFVMKPK